MTTTCEICADTRLHNLNNLERCDTCAVLPDDLTARRLAAAAPELLAALADMVEQIKAFDRLHGVNSCAICPDAAHAAIAKATGLPPIT
jgi:hypothetical protein